MLTYYTPSLGNVNGFHEMFTFRGVVAYEARGISPARRGRRTHGGGKRVDTNGFYPLNSHFLLFLSLAQTRDRRPLQNGERQSGYRSVSFSAFSHFTDSLLLHIWLNLRRVRHKVNCPKGKIVPWGMTVPHKSLTRYIVGRGDLTPPFFTICCHLHTAGWGHPALQDRFCNG